MTDTNIVSTVAGIGAAIVHVQKTKEDCGLYEVKGEDGLVYTFTQGTNVAKCGARTRSGAFCLRSPLKGRNRCAYHGGKSPRGVAAARFTNGMYTKDIPSRLAQRYNTALNDDKLLELRDEIAVFEARIGDLLSRTDSGESGAMWNQIKTAYADLRVAAAANNQQKFAEALNEMGRLIVKGAGDYAAWDEVFKAVSARRRLVETERKRMVDLKQMMTAEQAMSMLGFVVNTLKSRAYAHFERHEADKFLADVSADISQFISQNGGFSK